VRHKQISRVRCPPPIIIASGFKTLIKPANHNTEIKTLLRTLPSREHHPSFSRIVNVHPGQILFIFARWISILIFQLPINELLLRG
jgi:hypothetical protein